MWLTSKVSMQRRILAVFFTLFGLAQATEPAPRMNSLMTISPYKHDGLWVFDDEKVGLRKEPFVSGADDIMDLLSAGIPEAERGFTLVFSSRPFPGYTAWFVRGRTEHGGTWYSWAERSVEGWLCPALFKYFESAPPEIYVQVKRRRK